ncbi:hypothetical protein [Pseudonocardia phyllosphaerae]|uniref:hypothetical protein n=1 Tax=Pseudonocardia phyllosphaerae TaxID=3390502 RepID=UPI00397959F6
MRTLDAVLRLLLSPKWLTWHVCTLGAMVTCGFLAAWQWGRAGSAMGSAVNVGYGLQWPLFAVFFGYMWWRFLRMEIATLPEKQAEPVAPQQAPQDGTAEVPEARRPVQVEPESARPESSESEPASPEGTASVGAASRPARRSPFTPRPAGVEMARHSDPQLRAYNDELARLAERDREETT